MRNYILKHRNDNCAILLIDEESGALIKAKLTNPEIAPFLGGANESQLKKWWSSRAIPGSRKQMQEIIRQAGCNNPEEYLAKNLALSITDNYWVCPIEMTDLKWEDVCLFNLPHDKYNTIPYHNDSSYDPNASLGGQLDKYWDMESQTPVLVKHTAEYYSQQIINEEFASIIHKQQNNKIPYTYYSCEKNDSGGFLSKCDAFTTPDIEYISAFEVIESEKTDNSVSNYDSYIQICEKHGIDKDIMQYFMDYQTITDFIITNVDEHLMNFGVLRDSASMKLISPAPIFDSGNSMFYKSTIFNKPLSRTDILSLKITAIHDCEEKMLKHIRNKSIIDFDALPDCEFVKDYYCKYNIPEEKADFIAKNYQIKVEMAKEFAKGKSISLYNEKQKERKQKQTHDNPTIDRAEQMHQNKTSPAGDE